MKGIDELSIRLIRATLLFVDGLRDRVGALDDADPERDRGDVPGLVMIALMTAIVVIGLLAIFRDQVFTLVENAFNSITK